MIVLFVFGYTFYKLASTYDKQPWLWAIVGAGSYIAIQLLLGVGIAALYTMGVLPVMNEMALNIAGVLIASAIVYFGYNYLKKKWEREDTRFDVNGRDEINNIGKL